MGDFAISESLILKMSNDLKEFLFVSTTEGTEPTKASTTTEAITTTTEASTTTATATAATSANTTTTSTATTSTTTTTTTPEATTTEEPKAEAATTTTEETTTTAPPLVAAEVVIEFQEATTIATPATEVQISSQEANTTEQTTTAAPALVAEEVSAEETIDWSTFANEINEKVGESASSDENREPDSEGSDKVVEPEEEISIVSTSYFSCSSPVVADDGSISPPGKAVLLEYDYDLTTNASLDDITLSGLDDGITMHLAEIFGLTSCRRRHLRGLKADIAILALDSKPVDVSVADASECVTTVVDESGSCTPIKGFMTAYVEPNSDAEAANTKLLSLIEEGMASGAYTDDNIIKTSYIGTRSVAIAGDTVDDTKIPVISEIQVLPLNEKDPPILAIGLSAFLLVFAALMLLCAFFVHRRKKNIEETYNESVQQQDKPDVEKTESAESTVDLTEKGAHDMSGYMCGNVATITLSSSGEESDLQIAMTEDYSNLVHHFNNYHDINQVHRFSVIDSDSSVGERSFEAGTPITTPITSPGSSPEKLLPRILSPEPPAEDDLLADVVYYGTTLDSIPI